MLKIYHQGSPSGWKGYIYFLGIRYFWVIFGKVFIYFSENNKFISYTL